VGQRRPGRGRPGQPGGAGQDNQSGWGGATHEGEARGPRGVGRGKATRMWEGMTRERWGNMNQGGVG
jgi:hypothetical protein